MHVMSNNNYVCYVELSAVTACRTSQQILVASKYDQILYVYQLGYDQIVFEEKYHRTCYKVFMRITSKTADSVSKSKQGPILELSEVWNRYCELVEQAGTGLPTDSQVSEPHSRKSYN